MRLGVNDPGGLQDEQPILLELDPGVGDELLDRLLVGEPLALGAPGQGTFAHHVEGAAALADGAHGVVDAAAAGSSASINHER